MRRAPGRPKKQRNKTNDEPKSRNPLPRYLSTITCANCKKVGHNKRSCKGKTTADREIPKGGNKKQKTTTPGHAQTSTQGATQTTTQGSAQVQTVLTQGSQAPSTSQV
ncbi:tyrosine-protein kinase ABL1 [Trifolium repens]|nr:tyrosine-protein kinase ABL1 [Trifolium repens]